MPTQVSSDHERNNAWKYFCPYVFNRQIIACFFINLNHEHTNLRIVFLGSQFLKGLEHQLLHWGGVKLVLHVFKEFKYSYFSDNILLGFQDRDNSWEQHCLKGLVFELLEHRLYLLKSQKLKFRHSTLQTFLEQGQHIGVEFLFRRILHHNLWVFYQVKNTLRWQFFRSSELTDCRPYTNSKVGCSQHIFVHNVENILEYICG